MKKISLVLAGILAGFSFANADFLSISAGAGIEQQKISGYVKNGNTINYFHNKSAETDGNYNTGNLGLKDKNNPFVWLKIIHPIPVVPNIKFQYTKYHSTGHSNYIAGGGVIISSKPLYDVMPLKKSKEGDLVTEWQIDELASMKFLKIDMLGLSTLSVIKEVMKKVGMTIDDLYKMSIDRESLDEEEQKH